MELALTIVLVVSGQRGGEQYCSLASRDDAAEWVEEMLSLGTLSLYSLEGQQL